MLSDGSGAIPAIVPKVTSLSLIFNRSLISLLLNFCLQFKESRDETKVGESRELKLTDANRFWWQHVDHADSALWTRWTYVCAEM